MVIPKRIFFSGLAIMALGALSACGGSTAGSGDALSIAYAADEQTPFVATVTGGIRTEAEVKGAEFTVSDNHSDAAKVITNANNAATRTPSVFVEYSSIADANDRVAKIMSDAEVPVLAVQYPVGDAPLYAVDNPEVGRLGGEALAKAAVEKWGADGTENVLILALPSGGQVQLDRSSAAERAFAAQYPAAKATVGDTKLDPAVARQVTADFLSSHPGEKVAVWAHLDSMALGAIAAAKAANREDDVLIVGTSGDKAVVEELQRKGSPLVATVALFPERWGAEIVSLAEHIANGDAVEAVTHPGQMKIVTAETAHELDTRN